MRAPAVRLSLFPLTLFLVSLLQPLRPQHQGTHRFVQQTTALCAQSCAFQGRKKGNRESSACARRYVSLFSLSHSLSCFSSLPFRLLRQGTHRFTCQVSPCVHRSASCSPRAAAALLLFRLVSLLSISLSLPPSFSLSISLSLSRGHMRDKWEPHNTRISSLAPCPER